MFWGGFVCGYFMSLCSDEKNTSLIKQMIQGGQRLVLLSSELEGFHFSVLLSFILHRQTGSVPFSYFLPFQRHKHALNQIEWMEVEYLPMTTGRE